MNSISVPEKSQTIKTVNRRRPGNGEAHIFFSEMTIHVTTGKSGIEFGDRDEKTIYNFNSLRTSL